MVNAHGAMFKFLALGLAVAAASPALAGDIGATSRAALTITASVAPRFEIGGAGLKVDQSASSAASESRGVCIYANTPTRLYSLILLRPTGPLPHASNPDGSGRLSLQWTSLDRPSEPALLSPGGRVGDFLAGAEACGAASVANAKLTINRAPSGNGARLAPEFATLVIVPE